MTPYKLWYVLCNYWLCSRTECEVCRNTLGTDVCTLNEDQKTMGEAFKVRMIEFMKAVFKKLDEHEAISDEEFAEIFREEAVKWTT